MHTDTFTHNAQSLPSVLAALGCSSKCCSQPRDSRVAGGALLPLSLPPQLVPFSLSGAGTLEQRAWCVHHGAAHPPSECRGQGTLK